MIKQTFIPTPVIISKFEKHNSVKDTLLKLLEEEIYSKSMSDPLQKISHTDWLDVDKPKKYWNFFEPLISSHLQPIFSNMKYTEFYYHSYWFQQYEENDFHDWHMHAGSNWTNVYYLELPNNETKTEIVNFENNMIYTADVEEGCVLTMPAIIWHRSPKNTSKQRKTVIAFNMSGNRKIYEPTVR